MAMGKNEYLKNWRKLHPNYDKEYREKNIEKLREKEIRRSETPMGRAHYLLQAYNQKDKLHKRGKGDLTAQWIIDNIFTKKCVHCGKIGWDVIGCNRLDNSKPHTKDNVEPCCEDCNTELGLEYAHKLVSKTVYQYTLNNELVAVYISIAECGRNGFDCSGVSRCCRGLQETYKGFKWSYTPL